MLIALLVLELSILLAVAVLLLRRPAAPVNAAPDARLEALLAADLPGQLARVDTRASVLDDHLRAELAQLRRDSAEAAVLSRQAANDASRALREEVQRSIQALGATLHEGLSTFRADNKADAERLRTGIDSALQQLAQRFAQFAESTSQRQLEDREALNNSLRQLGRDHAEQGEKLRNGVEERLNALAKLNEGKLEEMRATVDEKLQKTLNARLTESFGQVTTHLGEVQKGLGEMKELATGVGDLKKVLTNVKTRGIVGEFLLGQQLEQMFSPEQYVKNARIKPQTTESVEFALKFPNGPNSTVLLPIDSKFPREVGEKLMHAYENGTAEEIAGTGRDFERAIRLEARKICDKYIDPPTTLPHAVMFLPTEALYAEVMRRPGLQSEIQQQCRVTIAGPSTLMALLTSFQMGFHTLAIEKKGNEVWNVLARAKKEFESFGGLMDKMEKQVGTVQNTIKDLGVRSRAIGRSLKDVASLDTGVPAAQLMSADNMLPMLAASDDLE